MKKYFCTFADSRMGKSLKRVKSQVKESGYFDEIYINNEEDLDNDFKELFKDKLVKGSRGYGYWAWKPQIVLQTLKNMEEGNLLLYMDAGCHFNKNGLERLNYYFKRVKSSKNGLLVFQEEKDSEDKNLEILYGTTEKFFTKGDLFDYFKVRNDEYFYNTGQIAATAFFIKKCEESEKIIKLWLMIFENNFSLADNTESVSPNFDGFIEHRHDQSIFSILCKQRHAESISSYEIWQRDWKKLDKYPIQAKRDKDLNFYWRFRRKILSLIKRDSS